MATFNTKNGETIGTLELKDVVLSITTASGQVIKLDIASLPLMIHSSMVFPGLPPKGKKVANYTVAEEEAILTRDAFALMTTNSAQIDAVNIETQDEVYIGNVRTPRKATQEQTNFIAAKKKALANAQLLFIAPVEEEVEEVAQANEVEAPFTTEEATATPVQPQFGMDMGSLDLVDM